MFIRSKTHPYGRMLSIEMVRLLILSLYVLYPLGCLLQLLPLSGATETWLSIAGLVMIVGALIAFAVKANSNLSVLATLARLGCGADTVSEGEIRRALTAGIPANRIIFSGVGKTDAELAFAIEVGVRQINVESAVELDRLIAVAASKGAPDWRAATATCRVPATLISRCRVHPRQPMWTSPAAWITQFVPSTARRTESKSRMSSARSFPT